MLMIQVTSADTPSGTDVIVNETDDVYVQSFLLTDLAHVGLTERFSVASRTGN